MELMDKLAEGDKKINEQSKPDKAVEELPLTRASRRAKFTAPKPVSSMSNLVLCCENRLCFPVLLFMMMMMMMMMIMMMIMMIGDDFDDDDDDDSEW